MEFNRAVWQIDDPVLRNAGSVRYRFVAAVEGKAGVGHFNYQESR